MTVTAQNNVTAAEIALIGGLKSAAKDAIDASGIRVDGQPLTVYAHEPVDAVTLPAIYITGPDTFRKVHDADSRNRQLGSFDWQVVLELLIRTRMDDPETGQANIDGLVGAVVASINRVDPTLNDTALLGAFVEEGSTELEAVVAGTRVAQFTAQLRCEALTPVTP